MFQYLLTQIAKLKAAIGSAVQPSDINYAKGTLNFTGSNYGFGNIASSSKSITLTVPVSKKLPEGTYAISSFKGVIRGVQGLVDIFDDTTTERVGTDGYTFAAARVQGGCLLAITITKTTAFTSATNQTPVNVVGNFVIDIT